MAKAARDGDFETIDEAKLGTAIKWKIAFMYQDRKTPKILPIYKESHLKAYLGITSRTAMSVMYSRALKERKDQELFSFARHVWKTS